MINGNVKTIASGQDARLYYVDINGERKKYLIDGEVAAGDEGGAATKSEPLFLYLVENTDVKGDPDENGVYIMPDERFGTEPAAKTKNGYQDYKNKPLKTVYKNILWDITDNFVITPLDNLCFLNGRSALSNSYFHIKVKLYIDDILVRHSDDNYVDESRSIELPIPLTFVDYDKEITGKQLKIKVEYTYNKPISSGYVKSDVVQTEKYTDRTDNLTDTTYPTTGLAKNIDVTAYFSDPLINLRLDVLDSDISNKSDNPYISEFYDSFQNALSRGWYWYMPNGYVTNYLAINGIDNNSMIRFNTDPDNDFTFDITINYGWYINKPFSFERGKSYIIAAENNTIYWSEVQVNE